MFGPFGLIGWMIGGVRPLGRLASHATLSRLIRLVALSICGLSAFMAVGVVSASAAEVTVRFQSEPLKDHERFAENESGEIDAKLNIRSQLATM